MGAGIEGEAVELLMRKKRVLHTCPLAPF